MKPHIEERDVIVIGGGAAGMFAAGVAASRGKQVLLLEKNAKLGEKLAITGGTRCNILNAEENVKALLKNYGEAEKFLYSPFSQFGMQDAYDFFESRGLPLKVELKKRVFPKSERAVDVVTCLREYIKEQKVQVRLNAPVIKINRRGGRIESVQTKETTYRAKSFIFAAGGLSHPETGSTGDAFPWLESVGHTIKTPTPTIVPLKTKERWVHEVAGVTVPSVKITFTVDDVKSFSKTGPLLFTHTDISGPTVLNSSGRVAELFQEGEVGARLDFFPESDVGVLDRMLTELFELNKNKDLKNVFRTFVPPGMSVVLLERLPDINVDQKVHSVTKEDRRRLAELLKGTPLTITGLMGFDRAVVADGGVPLTEIDMRTMRSLKADNAFIIGDLLHIVRPSGGYSLQICWTSGYVAGMNA